MKPAWDQLMAEFKDSDSRIVGDVDCTADGKDLCEKQKVSGYPTIKYGDPLDLKDYSGGRDFESLKAFAEKELGPVCGPAHVDLCDEATQKQLTQLMGTDLNQLAINLKQEEDEVQAAVAKFNREWTVHIERPEGTLLGAAIAPTEDMANFQITKLQEGALETFNAANAADAVRAGDQITKVNAATGTDAMKAEFKNNPVDLLIVRTATTEEKANAAEGSGGAMIKSVMAFKSASAAKGEL